jgi:hypothetical protein
VTEATNEFERKMGSPQAELHGFPQSETEMVYQRLSVADVLEMVRG